MHARRLAVSTALIALAGVLAPLGAAGSPPAAPGARTVTGVVTEAHTSRTALGQVSRALVVDGQYLAVDGLDGARLGSTVRAEVVPREGRADVLEFQTLAAAEPEVAAAGPVTRRVTAVLYAPVGTTPDDKSVASARASLQQSLDYWNRQAPDVVQHTLATVHDWVRGETGTCSSSASMYNEAMKAVGYTRTAPDLLVLYLPLGAYSKGCSYGQAYMSSRTAASASYSVTLDWTVAAHELGHNMALEHSGSLWCPTGDHPASGPPSTCAWREYGDGADVMGNSSRIGGVNAHVRERLGTGTPLRQVTGTGTTLLDLAPVGAGSSDTRPRGARITDPDGVPYWVEHRASVGEDAGLAGSNPNQLGVRVMRASHRITGAPSVLDTTSNGRYDDGNYPLGAYRSWQNSSRKLQLRVLQADSSGARVEVVLSATPLGDPAPVPTPAPGAPTPPAEDDPDRGSLVAATAVSTAEVGKKYTLFGMVLDRSNVVMKGTAVRLQALRGGAWTDVKTVKANAGGGVSFPVVAEASTVPHRMVALGGDGTVLMESTVVSMPVHRPVTLSSAKQVPKQPLVRVSGKTAALTGEMRVEWRPVGTTEWTRETSIPYGRVSFEDPAFTFDVPLARGAAYEVRVVRYATAELQQSVSKTVTVKVG